MNALAFLNIKYSNQGPFLWCCCHLITIWTKFECTKRWFMSLYLFAFCTRLAKNFNKSHFFTRICEYKFFPETTHWTQSLRIRTCLNGLQHSKISEIKYKYFGFEHNHASIYFDLDWFDLGFATGFDNTFQQG